ncbi:uncharacterized protein LOC128931846 [Callithrix jacchus]
MVALRLPGPLSHLWPCHPPGITPCPRPSVAPLAQVSLKNPEQQDMKPQRIHMVCTFKTSRDFGDFAKLYIPKVVYATLQFRRDLASENSQRSSFCIIVVSFILGTIKFYFFPQ